MRCCQRIPRKTGNHEIIIPAALPTSSAARASRRSASSSSGGGGGGAGGGAGASSTPPPWARSATYLSYSAAAALEGDPGPGAAVPALLPRAPIGPRRAKLQRAP